MVTRAIGIRFRWWGLIFLGAVLAVAATISTFPHGPDPQLAIQADRGEIPAGGATAHLTVRSAIPLPSSGLEAVIAEGSHSARIVRTYFAGGMGHVTVQSKALPGKVRITAALPPFVAGEARITVLANNRDSANDGTPDVLRLSDPADEAAFRSWFTYLAEAQFFRETSTLPKEIADCAGLIRYAYREALRWHDNAWAKTAHLPLMPAIPSVRKYEYPYTPWGSSLFRTGPGTLAEFADAGTLLRYNTHLVARDIRQARPGDLIFFHQEDAAMPYHSMIYLGASQIENAPGPFVVYHTGPSGTGETTRQTTENHRLSHVENGVAGEIRRPSLAELMKHPDPRWHPVAENTHYLGVYRWNILWQ